MKPVNFYAVLLGIFLLLSNHLDAQEKKAAPTPKKNLFKINLTSLALANYGFQYERVITKHISLAMGYRTMPLGNIPLKDNIVSLANGDASMQKTLDQILISNSAFTPELRWYPGKKGFGKGFYIAPFARYANFHAEGLKVDLNSSSGNDNFKLSGNLNSNTYGLMFGAQWSLGKHVCLDWQILGPHYGVANASIKATSSFTLSQLEQNFMSEALNNLTISKVKNSGEVTSNSLTLNLTGPWAGIRAGISLGIKL